MSHSTHSARLHALAALLCALLLLVALGVMDANRAPWWALLATQGALLVVTASAGIWLDRAVGARRRGAEALREEGIGGPVSVTGKMRYYLPGLEGGQRDDADVFWQERILRPNKEDER